jgi:triacylglycerol lipase
MLGVAVAAATVLATVALFATPATAQTSSPTSFPNGKNPVIFVPGYAYGPTAGDTILQTLQSQGYTASQVERFDYDSVNTANETVAAQFAQAVDAFLQKTGASKVDVIAHSMGAISSRYCIKYGGCSGKIDHWISVVGVNDGNVAAAAFPVCQTEAGCKDMLPGSQILKKLNSQPVLPTDGSKWCTFRLPVDNVIIPSTAELIPGVPNTDFGAGHTHNSTITDANSVAQIIDSLSTCGETTPPTTGPTPTTTSPAPTGTTTVPVPTTTQPTTTAPTTSSMPSTPSGGQVGIVPSGAPETGDGSLASVIVG